MKAIEYVRSGYNFSPFDVNCFEKGTGVLNILRNHFEFNGITYDINSFKTYRLNKKQNKYRIIIFDGLGDNNEWVIQLNWFKYMQFSWIQKKCWIQQRSKIEYIIATIITIGLAVISIL